MASHQSCIAAAPAASGVMKFLSRYKSLRKLGALQLKSFASKLDQQRFVRNAGCLLLLNLWITLVCIFSCHVFEVSASSFIRDLGTRSFIILDVIWTCQFLPQWRPMEERASSFLLTDQSQKENLVQLCGKTFCRYNAMHY